jgi:hypothetical protein
MTTASYTRKSTMLTDVTPSAHGPIAAIYRSPER